MKLFKQEKGITIIALTIMIILLVILAGIGISALTSNNGIIENTKEAKEETEKAELIENIKNDIIKKNTEKIKNGEYNDLTKEELIDILEKYGTVTGDYLKPNNKNYTLNIWELYDLGKIK